MIFPHAQQPLALHSAQFGRQRAAIHPQIIRQLLAVKGISNSCRPGGPPDRRDRTGAVRGWFLPKYGTCAGKGSNSSAPTLKADCAPVAAQPAAPVRPTRSSTQEKDFRPFRRHHADHHRLTGNTGISLGNTCPCPKRSSTLFIAPGVIVFNTDAARKHQCNAADMVAGTQHRLSFA